MLEGLGGIVFLHRPAHLSGGDLAVNPGHRHHLMAGGLHSAGLVDVDMAGIRAQGCLMGPQGGGDHGQIGLGPAHQEMDGSVRGIAGGADQAGGFGAVMVLAVAGGLLQVGLVQQRQHLLVAAFAVVIMEIDHRASYDIGFPPFYSLRAVLSRHLSS